MNADKPRFRKPGGARLVASRGLVRAVCLLLSGFWLLVSSVHAVTFAGNSRVEVTDPTGALSWNGTALSVQCWFKISIPSGTTLTDNLTILVNRRSGSQSDAHAYAIYFNIFSGNVEFSARGSDAYTNTLIVRPYLDRWYHVAVVRQGENFTGYVDGREMFSNWRPNTDRVPVPVRSDFSAPLSSTSPSNSRYWRMRGPRDDQHGRAARQPQQEQADRH